MDRIGIRIRIRSRLIRTAALNAKFICQVTTDGRKWQQCNLWSVEHVWSRQEWQQGDLFCMGWTWMKTEQPVQHVEAGGSDNSKTCGAGGSDNTATCSAWSRREYIATCTVSTVCGASWRDNSATQRIYITLRMDSTPHRLQLEGLSQPLSACSGIQMDR